MDAAPTAAPGIVIIGAGQAGLQIAEGLRTEGFTGDVTLVGDECHAPYHRPPLSKAFLLGEFAEAQLTIRAPEALARKQIRFIGGRRVTAIDRKRREIELDNGEHLGWTGLAIATGSRPRPLPVPGADLVGVLPLRGVDDAKKLADSLTIAQRVVVIGGGFIGLEFAAVAARLGKSVTVLEAADRLMARVVSPLISAFYASLHRSHGVRIETGAQVSAIAGENGHCSAVQCADGRTFAADLVLVGIGIIPNAELAEAAGLACDRSILVDACGRTSDPAIVAAGDCAARRLADGTLLRLESVQNAVELGKSAAASLMGKDRPFVAAPWFWSDQFDVKLQMVGLPTGFDLHVMRGDPAERKFSVFYYRADRLVGVDSANRPQDHMAARKLLDKGVSPTPEQAADDNVNLNSLLACS